MNEPDCCSFEEADLDSAWNCACLPDRTDLDAAGGCLHAGAQLRPGLMRKAVAYAERVRYRVFPGVW